MRILGLDPGIGRTGYGVIDASGSAVSHRTSGCLTTAPRTPQPERLADLARQLRALVRRTRPELAAVERLFFSTNTSTAMGVGEARGVALAVLGEAGVPVVEFTPSAVKASIAAYGRAGKGQVQRMVQLLLRLPKPPTPDDTADALAVALTATAHLKLPR